MNRAKQVAAIAAVRARLIMRLNIARADGHPQEDQDGIHRAINVAGDRLAILITTDRPLPCA